MLFRFVFSSSLSSGVGREASKAPRVRRTRLQVALPHGFLLCLHARGFVLWFFSKRLVVRGTWPPIELGNEICQIRLLGEVMLVR